MEQTIETRISKKRFDFKEYLNMFRDRNFRISIILSCLGVLLLLILLLTIPRLNNNITTPEEVDLAGNNFFFIWDYDTFYQSYQYHWRSFLEYVYASYGYFVSVPIIIVLLMISGSTILIRNFKQTKYAIFTNFSLYLLPIIVGSSIASRIYSYSLNLDYNLQYFVFGLFLFPLALNIPIQLILLIEGKSFLEWTGLVTNGVSTIDEISRKKRILNFGLFLAVYIFVAIYPLIFVKQKLLAWNIYNPILWSIIFFQFYWLAISITITKKYTIKRYLREIIGILLPLMFYLTFILIINSVFRMMTEWEEFMVNFYENTSFPNILNMLLIKIALALCCGLALGFYSQKKASYIIFGIYSLVIIILFYFLAFNLLITYQFKFYTLSQKLYRLFDPFIFIIISILGSLLGKLSSRIYWKQTELKERVIEKK